MNMDKQREEFERVYGVGKYVDIKSLRMGDIYNNGMLTIAWTSWQAAQAAILQGERNTLRLYHEGQQQLAAAKLEIEQLKQIIKASQEQEPIA